MALYDDIYGIKRLKEKEKLERERKEKNSQLLEQIAKELKEISGKIKGVSQISCK